MTNRNNRNYVYRRRSLGKESFFSSLASLGGNQGFTLIETLIAVLILSTAIAGPLTIASRGMLAAAMSKDQITAYYLAQDALEYVRYARDTNTLRGADWLSSDSSKPELDLNNCKKSNPPGNGCYFDSLAPGVPPPAPPSCANPDCAGMNLYYNDVGHYFTYTVGTNTKTPFTRAVVIYDSLGADEGAVEITVTWKDSKTHSVKIRENIFDWQ